MHTGIRSELIQNQFGDRAHCDMSFIAIVRFLAYLRPPGIDILVALFRGLITPQKLPFARFDDLVFCAGIALLGSFNKGRIDNLAPSAKIGIIEINILKLGGKYLLENPLLRKISRYFQMVDGWGISVTD